MGLLFSPIKPCVCYQPFQPLLNTKWSYYLVSLWKELKNLKLEVFHKRKKKFTLKI